MRRRLFSLLRYRGILACDNTINAYTTYVTLYQQIQFGINVPFQCQQYLLYKFEIFVTMVNFQVVMLCGFVGSYQHFRGMLSPPALAEVSL
jgi:hypothetical protein